MWLDSRLSVMSHDIRFRGFALEKEEDAFSLQTRHFSLDLRCFGDGCRSLLGRDDTVADRLNLWGRGYMDIAAGWAARLGIWRFHEEIVWGTLVLVEIGDVCK